MAGRSYQYKATTMKMVTYFSVNFSFEAAMVGLDSEISSNKDLSDWVFLLLSSSNSAIFGGKIIL
jgi:hypothetical protein